MPTPDPGDPVQLYALARIREVARRITARVRKALGQATGDTDPDLYINPDEGTAKDPEKKSPPTAPWNDQSTLPPSTDPL